ncbi:MAG TPA: polysaccharide deacetylase family protein [Actinomycetota bacterium]|nr:polysaccharide deacetylase family protein [Actinomycetota bacterium]
MRRVSMLAAVVGSIVLIGAVAESVHLWRLRAYGGVEPICRVQTSRQAVALSFDDGPDSRSTPAVLDLLAADGDRATFFVLGERAALEPSLIRRIVSSGNELGNHTWSHPRLAELAEPAVLEEFVRTEEVLPDAGDPALVRAPFGEAGADTLADLRRAGMAAIHWSIAIDHYVGGLALGPREAAATIADEIEAGDIVLAHDSGVGAERQRAMEALRFLLPLLHIRGFEVTTVGDLLQDGNAVRADPRTWIWQSGFTCPDP